MSLYIGKDSSGTGIVHTTSNKTLMSDMRSVTPLHNTSFHSRSTFLECVFLGDLHTRTDHVWYDSLRRKYRAYQKILLPAFTLAEDEFLFLMTAKGTSYSLQYGPIGVDMLMVMDWSRGDGTPVYTLGTEIISTPSVIMYMGDSSTIIAPNSTNILSGKLYKVKATTLPEGAISIGKSEFSIGSVDISSKMFLNSVPINNVDTTFYPTNFQILNSKNGLKTSSLGIYGNSIGSYYDNIFYPIFGGVLNVNTTLKAIIYPQSTIILNITVPNPNALVLLEGIGGYVVDNLGNPYIEYSTTLLLSSYDIFNYIITEGVIEYNVSFFQEGSEGYSITFGITDVNMKLLSFSFRMDIDINSFHPIYGPYSGGGPVILNNGICKIFG